MPSRQIRRAALIAIVALGWSCERAPSGAVVTPTAVEATTAPADDGGEECTRGRPEPILAPVAKAPAPTFRRLGPYEATESTTLDGGIAASVRQFGCAHYAVEYAFAVAEAPSASPPAAWLERAADLMAALPVVASDREALRSIAEKLRDSAGEAYTYGDPLAMSEMETVSLRVEASPPGSKLIVLYDVAL